MRRTVVVSAVVAMVELAPVGVASADMKVPAQAVVGREVVSSAVPCPPFGSPVLCALAGVLNPLLTGSAGVG